MQLKNNLYTIKSRQIEGLAGSFGILLNPDSIIYQAHFPGQPITPGVCIVQMGKELLEEMLGEKLSITRVKNVKFLSIISPQETTDIIYTFKKVECTDDGNEIRAQIVVSSDSEVKAKISFTCAK